jgi:hypothetical protein
VFFQLPEDKHGTPVAFKKQQFGVTLAKIFAVVLGTKTNNAWHKQKKTKAKGRKREMAFGPFGTRFAFKSFLFRRAGTRWRMSFANSTRFFFFLLVNSIFFCFFSFSLMLILWRLEARKRTRWWQVKTTFTFREALQKLCSFNLFNTFHPFLLRSLPRFAPLPATLGVMLLCDAIYCGVWNISCFSLVFFLI